MLAVVSLIGADGQRRCWMVQKLWQDRRIVNMTTGQDKV